MRRRRALAVAALVVLVGWASGAVPGGVGGHSDPCPRQFPASPEEATRESAVSFAVEHEFAVAYNRVCQYPNYGLDETVAYNRSGVDVRAGGAFYVFAQQAFWYSTDQAEGDGAIRAVYRVHDNGFTRLPFADVEQRTPATPEWRNTTTLRSGGDLRALNFAGDSVDLRLELAYRGTGASTSVINDTYTLDHLTGVHLFNVVERRGPYALTVWGPDGRSTYEFTADGHAPAAVVVYVGPDGSVHVGRASASL